MSSIEEKISSEKDKRLEASAKKIFKDILDMFMESEEHRLKKINTRGSTLTLEQEFLKELLEEIDGE